MKIVTAIVVTLIVIAGAILVVGAAGLIGVAADEPHAGLTSWFLEMARDSAIDGELAAISVPELGAERAGAGAIAYRDMCAGCHGSPAGPAGVVGQGLNPAPPNLAAEQWSDAEHRAEAFWVIKHGIRMTGMPAFGATHDDSAIWDLVAFLERLPRLDRSGYEELLSKPAAGDGHAGHQHGGTSTDAATGAHSDSEGATEHEGHAHG